MGEQLTLDEKLMAERAELSRLVAQGKSLADKEVYRKSCQVDKLIVRLMKTRGN